MSKYALFVFNGDPMCFIHVLLNGLAMADAGDEAAIVIEGAATKLLPDLEGAEHPLHGLWTKVKERKLVAGVCKACAGKLGTLATAKELGFALLDEMQGHPSIAGFRKRGYEVITF